MTVVGEITAETPVNITVLDQPELQQIPGVNLDDRLRMVPGFGLFRRNSSLVANPTTQGISLRGIGSSGASRTLVLWDGVPVNDAFGGWVYWTRFAPEQIERIEIMRSASTSVFGDRAMGGAIALFTPSAEKARGHLGYEAGNLDQHLLTAGFAQPFRRMAISGDMRGYTTSGYFIVPSTIRGRVDTKAGVDFVAPNLRFDYFGNRQKLFIKADMLIEDRDNGTVLQRNSTQMGTVSGHYTGGTVNNVSLLGYFTTQEYHQSFSAIPANRNTETLTFRQTVPAEAAGGAFLYRRGFDRVNVLAGADIARVEGVSTDSLFPTGKRVGGGDQVQQGFFGQINASAGPAQFFFGIRHQFAGQNTRFVSPSGGVTIGRRAFRGRFSANRSFRAPTLNELFREFRAGNAVTQPNPNLRVESITGVETGFDYVGETRRLGVTLFRNVIDDIITNVTLSSTPALIVRQRQNAAAAVSKGVEMDVRQRWRNFTGEASWLWADSRFRTGPRVPQIPRHQGSAQLSYAKAGTVVAAGLRSYSMQFEDDINNFRLAGYAVLQFTVRQHLVKRLSAVGALENALDRVFLVGFSPTPNTGSPRMWRIGLRWN